MKEKGITLITLIITIILLIILASITLYIAIDKNGLIGKAKEAREKWKNAEQQELAELNNISEYLKSEANTGNNGNNCELISKDIEEFIPIVKKSNGDYIEVTVPEIEVTNSNSIVGYAFLLNGEVVEYTKQKEYIYTNLELNTSYNISIIAMDKQGKIKISKIITQETPNKLELYNNGNEYKNITGGWEGRSIANYGLENGQYLKANEYMYVKNTSTNPANASNYYASWVTAKPIDLSKYSKIVVEGQFITPPETRNHIIITTNSTNFRQGTYYLETVAKNVTKMEMDITNINIKQLYIAITCQNSNYNNHTEITIRNVWLEK